MSEIELKIQWPSRRLPPSWPSIQIELGRGVCQSRLWWTISFSMRFSDSLVANVPGGQLPRTFVTGGGVSMHSIKIMYV